MSRQEEGFAWLAKQPWVDVASDSVFELTNGALCESFSAVRAFRRAGRLPFAAAGNGVVDTTPYSPANSPDTVRVGGVLPDGSTDLPSANDPLVSSGRAYDTAGLMTMRIASAGTDGFVTAQGTSGSSPMVAGRVADLLSRVRRAVGDSGTGVRHGALVVARKPTPAGPLADGRLDADELLSIVLATSRPKASAAVGRYALEGYGWFNEAAARDAVDVVLGRRSVPARLEDDAAYTGAIAARSALATAKGCTRPE